MLGSVSMLKINVRSDSLNRLNRKLKTLPHVDTHPVYRPHVTVAYLKHRRDDPYWYRSLYSDEFSGEEFGLDRALFSDPDGLSGTKVWIDLWRPNIDFQELRNMERRLVSAELMRKTRR